MITPREYRAEVLLRAGVPRAFLDAMDHLDSVAKLRYCIARPDGAYHYLPQIAPAYKALMGWDITPVCDGANGDVFFVHMAYGNLTRFAHFELEVDEIYDDYGPNFQRMLADLLIDYYEFDDEAEIDELVAVGQKLGFVNSVGLFSALEQASENDARRTFELDKKWRKATLPGIIELRT